MNKLYAFLLMGLIGISGAFAQIAFDPEVDAAFLNDTVIFPESPLKYQVLFVGNTDLVQTTQTYGNAAGTQPAKQWHDFIGFTPDNSGSGDLGWVSVNHEMTISDDKIGDGGGMTVFKVKRDPATDTLIIVDQTLNDGRSGKYFNVDFVNTVGETGMNCGGITSSADGRIWTAEEWFRRNNSTSQLGARDTADFTIGTSAPNGFAAYNGQTVKKYQNYNYMVEIDPKQAVAIRKQYNWGRQPFEGGVVMPDNKTAYLGADATPGFFTKFVADVAGDFTVGKTYVYKHDGSPSKWVEIDMTNFNNVIEFADAAVAAGATMYNRLEWLTYNPADGNVYLCETGRDNPASRWDDEKANGAVYAPHHIARATAQGANITPDSAAYWDYYGRVLKYDVSSEDVTVYLEGGPYLPNEPAQADYPDKHLSNPDGLNTLTVGNKTYFLICEDLNGTSFGRMPSDISGNRACELFLLDASIAAPTVNDLIRIAVTPVGAEVTGAIGLPDGKTVLVNSQHPSTSNPFPYNNSLTFAITGWDQFATSIEDEIWEDRASLFKMYPNPVARELRFEEVQDIAIFTLDGKRVKVANNVKSIDVRGLEKGAYVIKNAEGIARKLIIE